jgi:hypothetical protein
MVAIFVIAKTFAPIVAGMIVAYAITGRSPAFGRKVVAFIAGVASGLAAVVADEWLARVLLHVLIFEQGEQIVLPAYAVAGALGGIVIARRLHRPLAPPRGFAGDG